MGRNLKFILFLFLVVLNVKNGSASQRDARVREYIVPVRMVWEHKLCQD